MLVTLSTRWSFRDEARNRAGGERVEAGGRAPCVAPSRRPSESLGYHPAGLQKFAERNMPRVAQA